MSDTGRTASTETTAASAVPRAVIHRHILDVAADRTEATMADIAAAVSGATVDLVESVLAEYGDPAETAPSAVTEEESMTATDPAPTIDETDLTPKQRETIVAIAADPDASQADLAERLGVSRATINQRVNGIDGFDWAERAAFATAVLENGTDAADSHTDAVAATPPPESLADLETRLDTIEASLEGRNGAAASLAPELAHKVIRAVVHEETIDADEELAVIRTLVGE